MVPGWLHFRLPFRVRPVQPSVSLLAILFACASQQSCSNKTFGLGQGTSDCSPGSLGCVCAADGSCNSPHICLDDRCVVRPNSEKPTTGEKTPSSQETDQPEPNDTKDQPKTQDTQGSTSDDGGGGGGNLCKENKDCANLDGPCTQGQCQNKLCVSVILPEDIACSDSHACISKGKCKSGVCKGPSSRLLFQNFGKGLQDWKTDTKDGNISSWHVASAKASSCDRAQSGEDPALDHSPGEDNMLAGNRIGSCLLGAISRDWDCLLSPKMDVSKLNGMIEFSYWRHLHSPPSSIQGRRGAQHKIFAIFDGNTPLPLEEGYLKGVNDKTWTRKSHLFNNLKHRSLEVSICVRTGFSPKTFAGWSVDDIRVRGVGCDPGL